MNKIPDTLPLLLIRPPFAPPGPASKAWTKLLPALRAISPDLSVCDAATDFVIRGIASEHHLRTMLDQVDTVFQNGALSRADRDAMEGIQDKHTSNEAAQQLSKQLTVAIKRIASPSTTDLIALNNDIKLLDIVLHLESAVFHPCRFHRQGFSHDAIDDPNDLIRFSDDAKANPFWQYAFNQWQPFGSAEPPALALLYLEHPGQIIPVATMVLAWRKRWPEIPLHLLGPITEISNPIFTSDTSRHNSKEVKECIAAIEGVVSTDEHSDTPLTIPESQPLKADEMPAIILNAIETHQPLIVWRPCGDHTELVTQELYKSSRQGIWNHLVFEDPIPAKLETFAANNANIVHSYCYQEEAPTPFSDPVFRYPKTSLAYGQTQPLPGQPLWMALQNSQIIEMLLSHNDLKDLIRLRIHDEDQRLFQVGKNIEYHFNPPGNLPDGYLEEIVNMVAAGGSVNTQFVRQNLEKAFLIAYVEEEGVIIGNSCLKHPREEYMDAVSQQSGIDLHNFLERGYTSVRPDYRGLGVGAKLLEGLTQRAGNHKIFSVIAEGNLATQKMALRNRTRRVATFFSQRAQKEMSVWIPEWMLPEGIVLPEQPDEHKDQHPEKDAS